MEMKQMSLERVIKALVRLGLSRLDAEVYVYIASIGPQKALTLVDVLGSNKLTIYVSLRNLQTKKLVTKNHTIFSALPFEEALDLLIQKEKEQTQALHESKEELVTTLETED
jgi:sugar-specific transcriptional regulator TrmB